MSCYECGRAPGDVRCRYEGGCPHGDYPGPNEWEFIPVERGFSPRATRCSPGHDTHAWVPDWNGRGYTHMRCTWCGKRDSV